MSIDPILPLSIAMAEGKGTYAVFLGSGVSKEAGIPTGGEIFYNAVKLLYKLDNNIGEIENNEDVDIWFEKSEYKDFTYSKILEELCPKPEERRQFLEEHFLGKKPTDSHYLIADLVSKDMVKVIVTTNFDRLMETALDSRNIAYTIISSEEELKTSHPREHSNCWILKLHGDYKRLNIKNTNKELEKLEDNIEKEFQEILDRFGIVMVGYSGSDRGVMTCFKKRDSKYTLYWLARDKINDDAKEMVNSQDGRIIKRESSDKFFEELKNKIDLFQAHETGETPEFLIKTTKGFIRNMDFINFHEMFEKQTYLIEENFFEIYKKYGNEKLGYDKIEVFKELERYVDNITAMGLILIEYYDFYLKKNSTYFFGEWFKLFQIFHDLPDVLHESLKRSHIFVFDTHLGNLTSVALHDIFFYMGAYILKREKFGVLKRFLELTIIDKKFDKPVFIWSQLRKDIRIIHKNQYDFFEFIIDSYDYKDFLKEFFKSKDELRKYICQFNVFLTIYSAGMHRNRPREDLPTIFPYFSIFYDESDIELLFVKIKSGLIDVISELFNIQTYKFYSVYKEICQMINLVIEDRIKRFEEWEDAKFIPCDIFDRYIQ